MKQHNIDPEFIQIKGGRKGKFSPIIYLGHPPEEDFHIKAVLGTKDDDGLVFLCEQDLLFSPDFFFLSDFYNIGQNIGRYCSRNRDLDKTGFILYNGGIDERLTERVGPCLPSYEKGVIYFGFRKLVKLPTPVQPEAKEKFIEGVVNSITR